MSLGGKVKEPDRMLLIGTSSIDTKIWTLRKAYGENAAVVAFLTKISNVAELDLLSCINKLLGKKDLPLDEPTVRTSLLRDFVDSTKEIGIPVSIKELMLMGVSHGEEKKEEKE